MILVHICICVSSVLLLNKKTFFVYIYMNIYRVYVNFNNYFNLWGVNMLCYGRAGNCAWIYTEFIGDKMMLCLCPTRTKGSKLYKGHKWEVFHKKSKSYDYDASVWDWNCWKYEFVLAVWTMVAGMIVQLYICHTFIYSKWYYFYHTNYATFSTSFSWAFIWSIISRVLLFSLISCPSSSFSYQHWLLLPQPFRWRGEHGYQSCERRFLLYVALGIHFRRSLG